MKSTNKVYIRQLLYTFSFGLFLLFVVLSTYLIQPSIVSFVDLKIYDAFLTNKVETPASEIPIIIDLDEASLKEFGQWPWPRYLVAILVQELTKLQASAIALDILLSEPDRSSPDQVQSAYRDYLGINLSFNDLPDFYKNTDAMLAEVMSQGPVITGFYLRFLDNHTEDLSHLPKSTGLIEQTPAGAIPARDSLNAANSALLPLDIFFDVAPVGAINVSPDMDGIVRKVPLVTKLGDHVYANLALRSVMQSLGIKNITLQSSISGLQSVKIGKYLIPVSPDGYFNIYYRGARGSYKYISAKDVLQGTVDPAEIQGKIAFVGTSAAGLLDIRAQPYDSTFPGVEVHAATVDSILSQQTVISPSWTPAAQFFMIIVVGLMAIAVFGIFSAFVYLPFLISIGALLSYLSYYLFAQGIYLSPFFAIFTLVLEAVGLLAIRYFLEEKQKRVLKQAFSRYVAPEIVAKISERGDNVFSGEERELSIIFTDVRGFTTMSEKLKPDQVVKLLNRYFTPMTSLIRNHMGTLDKFIGDAIMAFWNAPLDVPDHASKSIEVAIMMQETLTNLNPKLQEEFGVNLAMGAGVHTGNVYVGNMGSEELLDYTCIGDNVNLASRLEGLCPKYGVGLVLSSFTKDKYQGNLVFQKLDLIRVKGKKEAVEIYTAHRAENISSEELGLSETAIQAYQEGNFLESLKSFQELAKTYPKMLYNIYIERCLELSQNPPENWNGVWIFESK